MENGPSDRPKLISGNGFWDQRFDARTEASIENETSTTLDPSLELTTPSPGLDASEEAEQKSVDLDEDELPTYIKASELARAPVNPDAYNGFKASGESKASKVAKVKQSSKTTVVRKGRRRPKFENFREIENDAEVNDADDVNVHVDSFKSKTGVKKVDFGAPALSQSSRGRSAKVIGRGLTESGKR